MKKTIKIYSRFLSLENQGQGRVTVDLYEGLKKDYNVLFNGTKLKSALGYLFHFAFWKVFDLRRADYNIALTSMDTFYLNPKKSYVIVHDLIPLLSQFEVDTHYNSKWWNQWGSMIFFYLTLKRALKFKKIICISSKTKNELIKAFPQVDKSKIVVINNGIPDKYIKCKRKENNKLKLYYVGALDPRKRVLDLIKWFNKAKLKDVELIIGGKGADYNKCLQISKTNKDISMLGFVKEKNMVKNYQDCDVFIFPTIEEGFGMPIVEAGCCNRPVITLECGKIPKEVKQGTLISSWNSLSKYISNIRDNKKLWDKLAKKSYDNSKQYQYDYINKIKDVISNNK